MALLLLSRSCNAPILRTSVLKQVSRKVISRTFARRYILKKQARTPPANKLAGMYKMVSLLFSRTCNASALSIKILKQIPSVWKQIFRTCVDEKSTDALRTRVSRRLIHKKQVMAPPTDKSAEMYKKTSLFSKAYNGLILRVKVLNHILRIQIFRTFADKLDALRSRVSRRLIHKKQVMAPPTDRSTDFYSTSLSTRAYNGLLLRTQIFRTFADKLDALRTRISHKRLLKKQTAIAPPTNKSADIYKRTSLFSKAYNGLILRVKVLNQISRVQIYRTFADKLDALRTRVSRRLIHKKQVMAPLKDKSAEIYKMTSLFSKAYNDLILRVKVLNQIARVQIYRTFADKLDALRTRVSRSHILKEQALTSPTDKSAEIYKMTSLFSKAYNGLILRVKVLNEIPRIQIYRTFVDKLEVLRTRVSRSRILKSQVMAPAKTKVTEINYMMSLLFNKISTVLMPRFKILQLISFKQIFRTFADELNALRTRVARICSVKEKAITSAADELVEINKMASSIFSRICNDLKLRLKVLKQVPRNQIFGTFTYESPISALRTSRYHRRTNTDKRPNIDKGALTIGSIGIGTLFFYKLGLLNQSDNIEIYVYFGCSIAVAVASAMAALYSPLIMNILTRKGFMTQIINMAAIIGTGVVAQNIEYNPGFGFKQLAWLLYASVVGIMFTPMLIGPMSRRALHTTGVCVGLYVIGACAPKETLYDPINEALSIFMDILNIFIRIAAIFAKIGNKNK